MNFWAEILLWFLAFGVLWVFGYFSGRFSYRRKIERMRDEGIRHRGKNTNYSRHDVIFKYPDTDGYHPDEDDLYKDLKDLEKKAKKDEDDEDDRMFRDFSYTR